MAGYAGNAQRVSVLRAGWRKALTDFGIDTFHALEFFRNHHGQRSRPYSTWSDRKARLFLDRLLTAIERSECLSVGTAVEWEAFLSFTDGERRMLTGGRLSSSLRKWKRNSAPSTPYFTTLIGLWGQVIASFRPTYEGPTPDVAIHFVFSEQPNYQDHAERTFEDLRGLLREEQPADEQMIAGITFAKPELCVELQAADLLCFAWRRTLFDPRLTQGDLGDVVKRGCRGTTLAVFDRERLRDIIDDLPGDVRNAYREAPPP